MRLKFFYFFLLASFILNSQQRKLIKGKLLYRNNNVIAANVINNTEQYNTITDSEGEFEVNVKKGDEIIFSSVEFKIKSIVITDEILKKNRLVVNITERVNILDEIVISPENTEKFLDLKEEEFKGFDYVQDKSSRLDNVIMREGRLNNGIDVVNAFKLISKIISNSSQKTNSTLIPSKILPYVFEDEFFIDDLGLRRDEIFGFMEYLDKKLTSKELLKKSKEFLLIDYLYNAVEDFKRI
jgi:hypothetical protein|tara:strand:- start:1535 stop:2254 length:720 start_codon:yes stop_codon:yes gene_type:complete